MSQDDFHEFQLNGKQLVFLFMSATVVAVVIFLCGVMVGRGVRTTRGTEAVEASAEPALDPTAAVQPAPVSASPQGTPAAAGETLTYPDRLEDPTPVPETLVDPTAKPTPARAPAKSTPPPPAAKTVTSAPKPAAASTPDTPVAQNAPQTQSTPQAPPTSAAAKTAAAAAVGAEPKGSGYVVQVAATRSRGEADTIARRLAAKGYPTFVTTGGANMFRVRVGKYTDRRQAESIAQKLQKEEQFKPWITR